MNFTWNVIFLKIINWSVSSLNVFIFFSNLNIKFVLKCWENNISSIVHYWICCDYFFRAKSLLDFSFNIFDWVFHKYGWIRIRLTHFFLALFQAHKHMMGKNDWFDWVSAIISSEHVYFSLIETQLTDISFQEKDIGTLHAWIQNLRSGHIISLTSTHNSTTFFNSGYIIFSANINNSCPVFLSIIIDFIWSPKKSHIA